MRVCAGPRARACAPGARGCSGARAGRSPAAGDRGRRRPGRESGWTRGSRGSRAASPPGLPAPRGPPAGPRRPCAPPAGKAWASAVDSPQRVAATAPSLGLALLREASLRHLPVLRPPSARRDSWAPLAGKPAAGVPCDVRVWETCLSRRDTCPWVFRAAGGSLSRRLAGRAGHWHTEVPTVAAAGGGGRGGHGERQIVERMWAKVPTPSLPSKACPPRVEASECLFLYLTNTCVLAARAAER